MMTALLIGDSLSTGDGPGVVLANKLASHIDIDIDAKVGRPIGYVSDRATSYAVKANAYDLVILFLGTNDRNKDYGVLKTRLQKIKNAIQKPIIMVGPPHLACIGCDDDLNNVIKAGKEVFGDAYLDSRDFTFDLIATGRTSDGIHFTTEGALLYGIKLASAVLGEPLVVSQSTQRFKSFKWPAAIAVGLLVGVIVSYTTSHAEAKYYPWR